MKKILLLLIHAACYSSILAQTLVKDINPGSPPSTPQNFVALGNLTLFIADDGVHGKELWRTDSTASGTYMVMDINPGSANGLYNLFGLTYGYSPMVVMGSRVYFIANNATSGFELWSSDGTTSGTSLVKDINPGSASAMPKLYAAVMLPIGTELYFNADDGIHGDELWKSDGTLSGTVMIKDINASASSEPLFFFADPPFLYFKANDGINGNELWKSNGTTSGTALLADINGGSGNSDAQGLTKFNNNIYFAADDGVNGSELWKTDGTTPGTILLKDIIPGINGGVTNNFLKFNNSLFFSMYLNGTLELWVTDGTASGTLPIANSIMDVSNQNSLTLFNGNIFFSASDGINGYELWTSDGTTAGTFIFRDLDSSPGQSSLPNDFKIANGNLYFSAGTSGNGFELWRTDGTPSGTVMLNQICPGSCGSSPRFMFQNGNTLFFSAYETSTGVELYRLDLTVTGIPELSKNLIQVYPNPFSNQIQVSGTEATGIFILFDLYGKEIARQKTSSLKTIFNTEDLFPGFYILHYLKENKAVEYIKIYKWK